MKKTYLYPDGNTREKSLSELSPEEQDLALTPRVLSKAEVRVWNRKVFWQQVKATVKIPYELFLVVLTALILLPDSLIKQWKKDNRGN